MAIFRTLKSADAPTNNRLAGVFLAASLALMGCLAIFSATAHSPQPYFFLYRQIAWLILGMVLLGIASRVPRELWQDLTLPLSIVALVCLYALLVWGHSVNGMRGWFRFELESLPPTFSPILIQPSELAKPIFVLYLASVAKRFHNQDDRSWKHYAAYLGLCTLWIIPLVLQPDFGTLCVYVSAMLFIYWMQGGRTIHLVCTGVAGLSLVVFALVLHPYVRRRFIGFLQPGAHADGAGWHILQFRTTLANGGLTGADIPVWSQHYLPLGYSDSIFATVAERIGFLGLLPILLIIIGWLGFGLALAKRQPDAFSALVIAGEVGILAVQAALHISVTLGLLPPTGVTFPLLSYGGSSLAASLLAIGIVLAHSKTAETAPVHL